MPYAHVLIALSVISLLFFLPGPFSYDILTARNQFDDIVYVTRSNEFGRSTIGKILLLLQFVVRIFLAVAVLSIVNVINVFVFVKRLRSKRRFLGTQFTDLPNDSLQNHHESELSIFGRFKK